MKGCGGDERGRREGEAARKVSRRGRGSLCAFVCLCIPVSAGGRTSKTRQSKGCFAFSLFFSPPKLLSPWIPPPLLSDYSSVSPQRQPGLLDSVGHY